MLGQRELSRTLFPIGELRDKDETRELARHYRLPNAAKAESQDICFVAHDHRDLVRRRAPEAFTPGPVERIDGSTIGTHEGIGSLTVGQRRGVGVATGERLYVLHLDVGRNAAVVGSRDDVRTSLYALRDMRSTTDAWPGTHFASEVALRYRGQVIPCEIDVNADHAIMRLSRPALVAPGQAAVLYDGDEVIGGGTVDRVIAA
jgi:tRNA-specific 2-thiouridylase